MLLQGLFVPLTCPFYRDGESYLRKLEHNVGRYSLGPASGLVALASSSEASTLTDVESNFFLQSVAEFAAKSKVLIAGVQHASVRAALDRAETAARFGFDAILLSPPSDWARLARGQDVRELFLFYTGVADRSPLPVVLWSDATLPSFSLPVEFIRGLAAHANVVGLVDKDLTPARLTEISAATKEVRRQVTVTVIFEAVTRRMTQPAVSDGVPAQTLIPVASLSSGGSASAIAAEPMAPSVPPLKTRMREVGFQILSAGSAYGVIPLLQGGASGVMPQLAACAPQACFEAYVAWKDGDLALAEERAERLGEIDRLLEELGPAAVKVGCDFNGYFGGMPRLPRLPLTAEQRAGVEAALHAIRN